MKSSAPKARRKWPYAGALLVERLILIALAGSLLAMGQSKACAAAQSSGSGVLAGRAVPRSAVPLPRPRPVEGRHSQGSLSGEANGPEEQEISGSACRVALSDAIAVAPSIPDIHGPDGCGGDDLVRLEAVVLPDRSRVAVSPPAILRCSMASAIASWVRADLAPIATVLTSAVRDIETLNSFECRARNRVKGAKLSEHGHANALDLRALRLANDQLIVLTDRNLSHELRERILVSLCRRFSTVLGPGSDWYHEDLIHLDLVERRSNYRICQWDVWDPLPQIAPRMPLERPEQAPPR